MLVIYERTYKAIMVVNGLTTVYCNTPSLHLNNKTLQEKENSLYEDFKAIHLWKFPDLSSFTKLNFYFMVISTSASRTLDVTVSSTYITTHKRPGL